MKIQFASDLHLEFRENSRYLRDNGPMDVKGDILVLAGDTGYLGDDMYSVHPFWNWASENFEQVLVALGNHEFYKYYDLKTMQDGVVGEIRPNVHYYYNKVVTIQDVDFIISTLWAHIDEDNAFVTERGVADFEPVEVFRFQQRASTLPRLHQAVRQRQPSQTQGRRHPPCPILSTGRP